MVLIFAIGGGTLFAQASVQDIIITPTQPTNMNLEVWTDRAVGATYYQGENIHIYFKASQDTYVTIYDYRPDGTVSVLFPNYYQRNNYVRAGVVNVIPDPSYNYNLVVSGQSGRELIEAVATTTPGVLPTPNFSSGTPFQSIPKGEDFLKGLNVDIVGKPVTVATTYFYVGYVPKMGTVRFTSVPSGASLYVDGVYEGKTPLNLQLSEGNHLAVFWVGSNNASKAFSVTSGSYQTVSAVISTTPVQPIQPIQPFQHQTVPVMVSTNPSGALIFVNGRMLGVSGCTIDLEPGTYQFTIVKPDYTTVVETLTINPGRSQTVNFSLRRIQ